MVKGGIVGCCLRRLWNSVCYKKLLLVFDMILSRKRASSHNEKGLHLNSYLHTKGNNDVRGKDWI